MQKIKEFVKKYMIGLTFSFLICTVSVLAITYFDSKNVTYSNETTGMTSNNVQTAIDELYNVCFFKAGSQIIEDANLQKDSNECRYFFTGTNPNNYITFNNEKAGWQILSVECDGSIKIIKRGDVDPISNVEWNIESNNNWLYPATMQTYLNETYLNSLTDTAKNQIAAHDFAIGAISDNNNNLADQIKDENSTKWNGKIALITVSEHIRTNSNQSSCGTLKLNNDNSNFYTGVCKNTTWIYTTIGSNMWTLSPLKNNSNSVYYILADDNFLNTYQVNNRTMSTRPTLYLKNTIRITGGDGSKNNPYTIG